MQRFNLNHFFYFYEVARHGSFTRAARELMISQSALSVQIRSLEQALGVALFDRRRGGVDVTEAGAQAYPVAERVFTEIDRMVSRLQATERPFAGAVSVATVNSIGIYVLPDILSRFRRAHPDVRVRVDFKEAEAVVDLVTQNRVDFAIVPWQHRYADLEGIRLTQNKMFLVAPPDHPLAGAEAVSPRDLERYPFVGYEEGMHTRAAIDGLFKRLGLSIEYAMESSNAATLKHMVMAGMGLGILPDFAIAAELRRGQLSRLDLPAVTLSREVMLYLRRNRTLSPTRAEFVTFLREYFGPKRRRQG
jgi:DNA-binding transcriptional LysR family regulator